MSKTQRHSQTTNERRERLARIERMRLRMAARNIETAKERHAAKRMCG